MSEQVLALEVSLGIHAAAVLLLFAAGLGTGARERVRVVDLSVFSGAAGPISGTARTAPPTAILKPGNGRPSVPERPAEPDPDAAALITGTEAPSPAVGGTGTAGAGQVRDAARTFYAREQFEYIRNLIHRGLRYPPMARKMGWTGQVTVSFVIFRNGEAGEIRILKSSGFELLDRNAVETIRRTAPYPPPPAEAEFVMPITYRLE